MVVNTNFWQNLNLHFFSINPHLFYLGLSGTCCRFGPQTLASPEGLDFSYFGQFLPLSVSSADVKKLFILDMKITWLIFQYLKFRSHIFLLNQSSLDEFCYSWDINASSYHYWGTLHSKFWLKFYSHGCNESTLISVG